MTGTYDLPGTVVAVNAKGAGARFIGARKTYFETLAKHNSS